MSEAALIAIVDDDDSFRRATTNLVRSLGYAVIAFPSADALLKSQRFAEANCLIADVQMPIMSGIELQSKLIADGRELPIIFMTAFPETRARMQALADGAIGFLEKPFTEQMLINCLNKALAATA